MQYTESCYNTNTLYAAWVEKVSKKKWDHVNAAFSYKYWDFFSK